MTIDAHHHFWKYAPVEYGWIDDSMAAIRRDFLPEDLRVEIAECAIGGVISVQARQSLDETRWLLDLAGENDFIRGVVGWVDLVSADVGGELERFAANPKLKSVRHVIQGEADDGFILRADFNRGIRELKGFGLVYDILIFERHLPQAIRFVDAHPEQVFVLDHIAKPRIRERLLEPWDREIRALAARPNVYCKISGMVTEADARTWTAEQLRPWFDIVLEAFGPHRLMFGSDWPVCLVACGYARWHEVVSNWVADLSPQEQAAIFGDTAAAVYNL